MKHLQIWPETKPDEWTMRGGTWIHSDATVTVPEGKLRGGFIRSGKVSGNAQVSGDARVYG